MGRDPAIVGADACAMLFEFGAVAACHDREHFEKTRVEQFLRITIGTDRQCAALVAALREILP